MLTIVTLFGHSRDNLVRLVGELRHMVSDWVVLLDKGMEPVELCHCFPAVHEDGFDAGALRRQALAHVHTQWVLHLDSDEWYTALQLTAIVQTMKTCPKEVDCIKLPRRNIETNADWVGWPDLRPVVHRNAAHIFWRGRVEEWPTGAKRMESVMDAGAAILHLHLDVAARNVMAEARTDAESRSKLEQHSK